MNNAPAVYVPTQPEGNGITMPMLLSLLAHVIVLGVLIYTYQMPTLEIAGSIETTMVTPGELAQIQGQILANRAAAAEQAASASSSATAQMQVNESDSDAADQNSAEQSSQQVPVFTRSDEPDTTTSRPMLMSEIQQQRLLEQTQEYERNMAELAAKLDENAMEKLDQVERDRRQKEIEEQIRLKNFRAAQNKQPRVTSDSNGLGITSGRGGKRNNDTTSTSPIDLATDGEPNGFGSASNPSARNGGKSGSTRSTGDFKSGILDAIKSALNTPINTQGLTTSLSLKLDARGNVKFAKARGSNAIVNKAVEDAAHAASPLPIDFANPASFASLTIIVTID